ncbi:heterocycloanthracin/sonorensin family bacteriocin [Bacillus sp. SLBN-46]|jgi:heterocycloanthracin/sonorensin family bacteriocin|uniref:heterocycloanthracin/sonorensin family bacteriocin n=1 Tax=Bacillus sp. SLBN-46 TaxID=3042283 RepID=UPI0037BFAE33
MGRKEYNMFQNELQGLGIDPYQVGQLVPMDTQSQDLQMMARRCGGCGHCGGCGGFRCGGCGGFRCGGCGGFRCGGFGCFGCFGFSCFGIGIGFSCFGFI